jgi:hypothetical protein
VHVDRIFAKTNEVKKVPNTGDIKVKLLGMFFLFRSPAAPPPITPQAKKVSWRQRLGMSSLRNKLKVRT